MSEIKSLAYDNISTELNIEASAEMSDLSFLWKLQTTQILQIILIATRIL